ncbi:HipA family kinase [Methylibium petroleiphilum]
MLNEGARRVRRNYEESKTDELWVGTAYSEAEDGDDIAVYLRLADPQPLVAELVCAVIGRALGLPVPEPFVVRIDAGTLKGSAKVPGAPTVTYCFASRQVDGSTFEQLLSRNSSAAEAMIRRWEHLVPVTVFDEWLANPDRNFGNILYAAGTLWMIDHADAFGGSARKLWSLSELTRETVTNKLALLIHSLDPAERKNHLDKAEQWLLNPAGKLDIAAALSRATVARWQTADEQSELLDFITQRLTLTHSLLCTRLGHPQLPLPTPVPNVAASVAAAQSSSSPRA